MSLIETPPDSVAQAILPVPGPASRNGHIPHTEKGDTALRLSLATDLGADGRYGERWFLVTQSDVIVVSCHKDAPAHVDLRIPLIEIGTARTETLVDCGALLLIDKSGVATEALRYSSGLAGIFSGSVRALQAFLIGEEPSEYVARDMKQRKCPTCGDPLPEDTEICVRCIDRRAVLLRLLRYGLPYPKQVFWVTALMLTSTLLAVWPPVIQMDLIDKVLVPHLEAHLSFWRFMHLSLVFGYVLELIGIGLGALVLSVYRGRVAAWLSNHIVFSIRTQAYDRLQSLSLGYYDKRQVGSLLTRVTQDVNELQSFLVDGIQLFLVNGLEILFILCIMMRVNWQLTLLVLVPIPITVIASKNVFKLLWNRLHRLYYVRSGLSAAISSVLSGVRVVKAFAQETREKKRFRERSEVLFKAQVIVEQSWATYFPILAFISTLGTYVILYIGGNEVVRNVRNLPGHGLTLGELMMFLNYIGMLMSPLQQMTRMADWLSRSTAAGERVFEVIDAEPDVQSIADAVRLPRIEGRVELKNVHFSYEKNQNVLQDISFSVEPGEMIGLVGHSGAGKSTLINLLSRFYDVQEGAILIDGVDIRNIDVDDLRRQVGVVLQEPFLFPGTIADNIAYAKPDATRLQIMGASKAANAHDFVMRLADGYDTYVGERGARLSGGERQRLSIARAILHDPRILILDEATASVDTATEKKIQEAIGRLIKGRTTFAIAHRLSTLRNANRLIVLERGKLVEMGTHDELMALPDGIFRKLVTMQQEVNKLQQEESQIIVV